MVFNKERVAVLYGVEVFLRKKKEEEPEELFIDGVALVF